MSSEWGSIGRRIAFRREDLGMSQVELAKLCHVNSTTVSKWERDVLKPTRNIMELAEALDVTATWILRGHFELAITKASKDEALGAAKRAVALAGSVQSLIEGMAVGERLDRPMMEKLFNRLYQLSGEADYAVSLLPNPVLLLRTTKQREASIERIERQVDRDRKIKRGGKPPC